MSIKFAYTPGAYKVGTAFTVYPGDTAGDYDFSRNSVASRVDENGDTVNVPIDTPVIDYSDGGCPVLLLNGGVCGNSQQVYNPNSLVWKLNIAALSSTGIVGTKRASISDGTSTNMLNFTIQQDSIYTQVLGGSGATVFFGFNNVTYFNEYTIKIDNINAYAKTNGILVDVVAATSPLSLTEKSYYQGASGNNLEGKIKSDIVSDDLTDFDSTATSINDILTNSKLTIR